MQIYNFAFIYSNGRYGSCYTLSLYTYYWEVWPRRVWADINWVDLAESKFGAWKFLFSTLLLSACCLCAQSWISEAEETLYLFIDEHFTVLYCGHTHPGSLNNSLLYCRYLCSFLSASFSFPIVVLIFLSFIQLGLWYICVSLILSPPPSPPKQYFPQCCVDVVALCR